MTLASVASYAVVGAIFALIALGVLLAAFEQPLRMERRANGGLTPKGVARVVREGGLSLLWFGWGAFVVAGGGIIVVALLLHFLVF